MNNPASTARNDEWLALSPLLDRALELDGAERYTWIQAQEPEVASRLETLLLEQRPRVPQVPGTRIC